MAFTLPSDLPTNWVDDASTIHASDWNNVSGMGNAIKAAIGTIGYGTQRSMTTASETTTSASYTDLTTTTDQVTVGIGSSGMALLFFGAHLTNSGANYCYIGVDISGANTTAASDSTCIQAAVHSAGVVKAFSNALLVTGLTAGFTTFKLKYKVNTGTGTFSNRRISVIPLPATDGTHASATLPVDLSSSLSLGIEAQVEHRPIYDSTGAGSAGLGTSRSYTHTVSADAKAVVLYMNTSSASYSTTVAPTPTVTFGGQAMTLLGRVYAFTDGTTWTWLCAYGLLNPPTGSQTVSATLANSYTAMNTVAYTDVVGFGTVTANTGSSTNPTITSPSATGNKVVTGALAVYTQSMSAVTTNQRSIQNYSNGVSYGLAIGDGDGPYQKTIACTAATGSWAGLAVEVMRTVPTYTKPTWVGTGGGAYAKTNPGYSWIETVPADANLALLWVSEQPSDQGNTCTVTLGGTSMVEVTGSPWTYDFTSGFMRLRCFALLNPSTGPNKTIAITSNVSNNFHAHIVYYGGVTSIGPAVFTRDTSGATVSTSVPNTALNHLYAQAFAYRPADTSSTYSNYSGNQRALHTNASPSYTQPILVGDQYGNGATLAISATRSNATTAAYGSVTLDLSPAALPTPSTPTFVGLGAGRVHLPGNYSWTETVPSNATLAVLWVAGIGNAAVSATLGGTAMTTVTGSPFKYYSNNYGIQVLYLLNPTTGANKTLSLTNTIGNVNTAVTYYGGVGSVWNPTSVSTGAAGQQPQIAVSNTASNHLYVNGMTFRGAASWDAITGYDQNRRIDHPNYSYDTPLLVGDAVGNGGTLTFNGTRNNTTYEWGGVAVDLSPTANQTATLDLSLTPTVSFAGRSSNAVTFDSAGAGFVNAAAVSPSWSHTIGANAKALIVVATFYNNGLASPTFTNAKVGTTDLTLLGKFLNFTTGGWNTYTAYLYCLNPPTGTQTVTFTTGSAYIGANSFAYNKVSSVGSLVQTSTANTSQSATPSMTAACNSTDEMVIASVSGYTTAFTAFSPNERYKTGSLYWIVGDSIGTNGNVTLTATQGASTLYGSAYAILSP